MIPSQNKDFYLNPKIKKTNLQETYTKEQIEEYIKCSNDPVYFIEKYVKINSLDEGFINFKLRGYQKNLINTFHKERKVVLLSPRQSGKTISTAAYILHYVFFNPDKTVAILANKAPVAREILARIVAAYETIPFFLQPGAKVLNKGSIELGNNSRIIAAATSSTAIRGFSVNFLYLDEFAFVDSADDFFKSTFPTISSGKETKIVISSTPNGMNLFYKIFTDAEGGRNDFFPFKIDWHEVPGRNDQWKKQQQEILGEHGFKQEYGNEFLGSSDTLISSSILRQLVPASPEAITTKLVQNHLPSENNNYVCLVDVASGSLGDYSTITVIDITEVPYKISYTWRCNETIQTNLPPVIISICEKYNNAFLVIEKNGLGRAVVESCYYDYEYEHMVSSVTNNKMQIMSGGFSQSSQYGVEMTKVVKKIGCTVLKDLIESHKIIDFTGQQITELCNFIFKNNTYCASSGNNDDLVMNLVMFAWLTTQQYFKDIVGAPPQKTTADEQEPVNIRINDYNSAVFDNQDIEDVKWLLS